MTLPNRRWFIPPYMRGLLCSTDNNVCSSVAKFTDEHYEMSVGYAGRLGHTRPGAALFENWRPAIRVPAMADGLVSGADEVVDFALLASVALEQNNNGNTWITLRQRFLEDQYDVDLVTGKYYDGVNQWTSYVPGDLGGFSRTVQVADMPVSVWLWSQSSDPAYISNSYQEDFFDNGTLIDYNCDAMSGAGKYFTVIVRVQEIIVNYLNPVVNSLSRMGMPASGGVSLVLSGLAFDQSQVELCSTDRCPTNLCTGPWNSYVGRIDFVGKQGQGTYSLTLGLGQIVLDSDTQITIPAMPAMAEGTYDIYLVKINVGGGDIGAVYAYAGDWRAAEDGLMSKGTRFSFLVGDAPTPPKPPGLFFKWRWKLGGLDVDEWYAPIDIRGPDTFWDGRVLNVSSIKRSIDDFTGMYNISDMNVDLASSDKHFQRNLALGHCKNQVVEIYSGWLTEPVGWHEAFFYGIVDDYTPQGPVFSAVLKDISRRHFRKQMPRVTITSDEYPNAHPDVIGRGIPELLGLHSWTEAPTLGAIEALCVDTTTFKYVGAGAPVIPLQVYSNNSLQTEGAGNDYTISYEDGGRTYINFNADQGDNKVTFNCTGYSFAPWDSANGYVQNPARVLEFFMVFLNEVPIDFIDTDSFNDLADQFDDSGYGEIGRWAGTEVKDTDGCLQELLFSFGIKMWPDRYGRFTVGRKDLTNYETDRVIWAQIDTFDAPERPYNLTEAINYVKSRSDYQPAASLWRTALEREWGGVVDDYEQRNEEAWDYPWINSEDFLVERLAEDLGRMAYGHRTVSFEVSLDMVDDLEIFDNFQLQDPYGISASGVGDIGRYYYITGLNYDWVKHSIAVEAEDLQWLVGQCFLIGHCDDIPELEADASDWQQMFGYIGSCTTDAMPSGRPLKKICSCG